MMQQGLFTAESDDWYTPPELLASIRTFLGDNYHDPCPRRAEGEPIESGLWQSWKDLKVFCNPPYGRAISAWIRKAMTEELSELLLLVPARTDAKWFSALFTDSDAICFVRGRLRFSGSASNAPFPSAIVYRGHRPHIFAHRFGKWGHVVRLYFS